MKYLIALLIAALLAAGWWVLQPAPTPEARARLSGLESADDRSRYARALAPREFVFPQDHGPHNDFQTEWWYYTGNLFDPAGRHFGYQLTIFRRAIAPAPAGAPAADADWTTNQIYFAHFAVTDSAANDHSNFERLTRGGAGLAGASPQEVWIEDWRIDALDVSGDRVRVRASDGDYAVDLDLTSSKPIVKQGDRGLSQKSNELGNASYYYSITRIATRGSLRSPSGSFAVSGESWLDREWSTSALGENVQGWDWFALQLDDGRDLMLYKLRKNDGSYERVSSGTLIEADGSSRRVLVDDFRADPVGEPWRSSDGTRYPLRWRISIPSAGLELDLAPRINDQEMHVGAATYWEGAVTVTGASNGKPVKGLGYLEMTGYKESMKGRL